MKKMIALILTFIFLVLLSGCKNEGLNDANSPYNETNAEITLKSADEIYDKYSIQKVLTKFQFDKGGRFYEKFY